MKPPRNLTLVVNTSKDTACELSTSLAKLAEAHGVTVRIITAYPVPQGCLRGQDACCVIGGDGTLLSVVEEAVREHVPVLGINLGKLGFLTTVSPETSREQFTEFLQGRYTVTQRSPLQCNDASGATALALNDVVIKQVSWSRLMRLSVYCNEELVNNYACDGLIFSTPTGSTAYNLSAEGPLIHPAAQVICMTPICPHTLSNRTVVFPDEVNLKACCQNIDVQPQVAVDGKMHWTKTLDLPINIGTSPLKFFLIHPPDYTHFNILRNKLNWGY